MDKTGKDASANPKDPIGVRKWRTFTTIPMTVMSEVGAAFLEGHMKGYGRHNYRVAGATASVYIDAAMGHIMQWWEGEDIDDVSRINHLSKAIACLVIVRDCDIQGMLNDDRPPKANLDKVRADLQAAVDHMFANWPNAVVPYTEKNKDVRNAKITPQSIGDALGTFSTASSSAVDSFVDAMSKRTPLMPR